MAIKKNFVPIAPAYYGKRTDRFDGSVAESRGNNQTDAFLQMLQLPHSVTSPYEEVVEKDPNALDLDAISSVCKKHTRRQ